MSNSAEAWEEKFSEKHQRTYWFNASTGKSSWECPFEVEVAAPPPSQDSAPATKRLKSEHDSTDVVSSSYQPPVSGSAVDAAVMKTSGLPEPRITPDLLPSTLSMWARDDIQVNSYLAAVYKSGSIEDARGVKQKFKDITNPIQGRHLYNLVFDNKFTRTLEVGLAMGNCIDTFIF